MDAREDDGVVQDAGYIQMQSNNAIQSTKQSSSVKRGEIRSGKDNNDMKTSKRRNNWFVDIMRSEKRWDGNRAKCRGLVLRVYEAWDVFIMTSKICLRPV